MREKKSKLKRTLEYLFSIILIAVLLFVVLWILFFYKVIPTPTFLSPLFNSEDEVDSSYYDEDRFYSFLESKMTTETEIRTIAIDVDSVENFINAVKVRDNYFWELEVQNFYDGNSAEYTHTVWATDGKLRVDTVTAYTDTSAVMDADGTIIRNNKSGEVKTVEGDTEPTLASAVNIADIEFYITSQQAEMCEAGLIDTDAEKYLYVRFYTELLDKTDEFYISLDFGVVLFAYSEIASEKVFTQITRDFRADYHADSGIFKI